MVLTSIRLATKSDTLDLYNLLKEYVIEDELGDEFTNTQQRFEEHFTNGYFRALAIEAFDEDQNEREIIGCVFLSQPYNYVVGPSCFLHCSYVKPTYRDRGLEQELIKEAKKVCLDESIHTIVTTINRNNVTCRSAIELEGGLNMTSMAKSPGDFWFMSNHSSLPEFSKADYAIREAKNEDLEGVYSLLENLMEFEKIKVFQTLSKEEFQRSGEVKKGLYGCVILEHQCQSEDVDRETKIQPKIVGCMMYTKMYHVLKGQMYYLQGLYIMPSHKGKGLGKALAQATLEACQKRGGDGFIFMIIHDNKVSLSLFKSLHGVNMTETKDMVPYMLNF